MIVLLIIVSSGIILYGYLLMCRLDRFLERGGFMAEPETPAEKEILLYGELETIDEISHMLDNAALTYDYTPEPDIIAGTIYHWIGAFSQDDADNLLICLMAKRKNSAIRTMAQCNNAIYKNIFRQTGITVILENGVSANQILACLRG
ncbi:MAG: NAD-binding protein [Candidatus Pelethousia sp.]|nr:NAD-binding protein [Candidatus Pelethousia sp.]